MTISGGAFLPLKFRLTKLRNRRLTNFKPPYADIPARL